MAYRNWSIGDVGWVWPEDVDETGCENRSASRSIRIMHSPLDGKPWRVAEVLVDECDAEMMDDCRLIAAAPEMLDVLHSLNNRWDEYDEEDAPTLGKRLRDVIAKAEGGTA